MPQQQEADEQVTNLHNLSFQEMFSQQEVVSHFTVKMHTGDTALHGSNLRTSFATR